MHSCEKECLEPANAPPFAGLNLIRFIRVIAEKRTLSLAPNIGLGLPWHIFIYQAVIVAG